MKYKLSFRIFTTEQEAIAFCSDVNARATSYCRKKYPAHYTPWSNGVGTQHGFICWYRF